MEPRKKNMTGRERIKKYREKQATLRTDEENLQFKGKEKERIKMLMQSKRKEQVEIMSTEEVLEHKKKEASRIRLLRRKQKSDNKKKSALAKLSQSTINPYINPYKTRQSFSKALCKTRKELPDSPRRKSAVIKGLASEISLDLNKSKVTNISYYKEYIEHFFFQPDIVYTMPGIKDEMVVWDETGKRRLQKYFLIMNLIEAFAIYKESCDDKYKCGFSTFCANRPQNVLCLGDSPKDQCKCETHENHFMKLEAMGCHYDYTWWENVLCDSQYNSECWKNICDNCKDGKRFVPPKSLTTMTSYKQWGLITVPSNSKKKQNNSRNSDDVEYNISTKMGIVTKEVRVGEILDDFQKDYLKVAAHCHVKRIQAGEFKNDINDPTVRVIQIDYAMAYNCESQKEIQAALWSRGTVNLFTCAIYHKLAVKTMIFCTNYKGKDKFSTGFILEKIYQEDVLPDADVKTEIIWSDGPPSEFKNQFMRYLLEKLAKCYNKSFSWKYFATSHGKGVVDGIGGRVKSSVHRKAMSFGKNRPIVQDSESFYKVAKQVTKNTKVKHISNNEVQKYINTKPFCYSTPVNGISKMHVMVSGDKSTQLWNNSASYKSDLPPDIIIKHKKEIGEKSSKSSKTKPKDQQHKRVLSHNDVVKIINGNFAEKHAIIVETAELQYLKEDDEIKINYLKKSKKALNKLEVVPNHFDSRLISDLVYVHATVDRRFLYTIE